MHLHQMILKLFILYRLSCSSVICMIPMHWSTGLCGKVHGTLSAWRSGLGTGKRPRLDRTRTDQDRKIVRPLRTETAVRSSVLHNFKFQKTGLNRSFAPFAFEFLLILYL